MTKSRAEELNPTHRCDGCGVDHFYIPPVKVGEINYAPIEITVVADGTVTFTSDPHPGETVLASRVPVVGILWNIPGRRESIHKTILVLN